MAAVCVPEKTKASKEKQKQGRLLYSPKLFNAKFKEEFRKLGSSSPVERFGNEMLCSRMISCMPVCKVVTARPNSE